MDNIYIFCTLLGALFIIMGIYGHRKGGTLNDTVAHSSDDDSSECCGKHAVCEKRRLADAMSGKAQYFEDEDLDRFAGHASDDYSDDEIEEFRYVMYTMRPEEVLEWLESLQVREISLPDELKDEACMMMES